MAMTPTEDSDRYNPPEDEPVVDTTPGSSSDYGPALSLGALGTLIAGLCCIVPEFVAGIGLDAAASTLRDLPFYVHLIAHAIGVLLIMVAWWVVPLVGKRNYSYGDYLLVVLLSGVTFYVGYGFAQHLAMVL